MFLAISRNIYKIPHDVDVVVGIPRSGTLAAHAVALLLNKPIADIDSFAQYGIIYKCGKRGKAYNNGICVRKILLVDDSITSGNSMKCAMEKLHDKPYDIVSMAVFATKHS